MIDFTRILADSARPDPTQETDEVRGRMIAAHNVQIREAEEQREACRVDSAAAR